MEGEFIAVDLETTGLYPLRGDRVVEVGAVRVMRGEVVDEFHSLINCGRPMSKEARKVTKIPAAILKEAPRPEVVFADFRAFIGRSILVAHNAEFDRSFLRREFRRLGWKLANRFFCTLELCRTRLPDLDNHRLETVAKHLLGEAQGTQVHRAIDDARLVGQVWVKLGGL